MICCRSKLRIAVGRPTSQEWPFLAKVIRELIALAIAIADGYFQVKRSKRKANHMLALGGLLIVLGWIVFIVSGFWGFFLCLAVVSKVTGFWGLVAALFLIPVTFAAAPLYAGFAWGDWFPFVMSYGGSIAAFILIGIGGAMSGKYRDKKSVSSDGLTVDALKGHIDDPLRLTAEKHVEQEVHGILRKQRTVAPESISGRQASQLTDKQWEQLRSFNELVKTARLELVDSLQSDLMSDSKSAVLAVKNSADSLDLPREMAQDLRRLAGEAWTGIIMGVGVYSRAGKAIGAMGEIQERIEWVSSVSGRNI